MCDPRAVNARNLRDVDAVALSLVNAGLAGFAAAGIVARRRLGAGALFFAYLVLAAVVRIPVWLAPGRFYAWWYWAATDAVQAVVGAACAWELAGRAFACLPRARRRAWCAQAGVAAAAAAAVASAHASAPVGAYGVALAVGNGLYGRGWLFAVFLFVARYHRIPLDPFHRDVAAGFVVWSLVAGLGQQLAPLDGAVGVCRQVVASLLYPALLTAWAWAAWRPDGATRLSSPALTVLRPWRAA